MPVAVIEVNSPSLLGRHLRKGFVCLLHTAAVIPQQLLVPGRS